MQEYLLHNEIIKSRTDDAKLEKRRTQGNRKRKEKSKVYGPKIFPKLKTSYNHLQGASSHPGAPHLEPDVKLSLLPELPWSFALAPFPPFPLPLPPRLPPLPLFPATVPPLAALKTDSGPLVPVADDLYQLSLSSSSSPQSCPHQHQHQMDAYGRRDEDDNASSQMMNQIQRRYCSRISDRWGR